MLLSYTNKQESSLWIKICGLSST